MKKYYASVLSQEAIIKYGLIIKKFESGEIDYANLEKIFVSLGIEVSPIINDHSDYKIAVNEVSEHYGSKKYLPTDVLGYILNSANFKNVYITTDLNIIETLAFSGDLASQEQLRDILSWQVSHVPFNKRNSKEVLDWQDKIKYLDETIKNNSQVSTKK